MLIEKKEREKMACQRSMTQKERKREREREKGIYKINGGVRKEGSESEPASSTHIKDYLVCMPSSCGITLQ